MSRSTEGPLSSASVQSRGPWPFVTHRTFLLPDRSVVTWHSRRHRKSLYGAEGEGSGPLVSRLLQSLWMPWRLNWWIGVVFACGASLFMLGSLAVLRPAFAQVLGLDGTAVNAVFFAGSIPFTVAAYLQLYQAANARSFDPLDAVATSERRELIGWKPHDIGWLSCALQFVGTLFFNLNTFDAMSPGLDWIREDIEVWVPNLLGSLCFLLSGYLAFAEACHAYVAWKPGGIAWWITLVNLLGCVAFMVSAIYAFVPPTSASPGALFVSVLFTFLGAYCFLVGSLLMLPETAVPADSSGTAGKPSSQ